MTSLDAFHLLLRRAYIRYYYNNIVWRADINVISHVERRYLAADITFLDHATTKVIKPPKKFFLIKGPRRFKIYKNDQAAKWQAITNRLIPLTPPVSCRWTVPLRLRLSGLR
jgi:hypothetical protein